MFCPNGVLTKQYETGYGTGGYYTADDGFEFMSSASRRMKLACGLSCLTVLGCCICESHAHDARGVGRANCNHRWG